ncbi:lysine--tRNA ligase [Candidatus Woesearchaeota archaeon]|nr:lysine--tRNA ligase [Candidatus Woesearchaeota archaeon]
MKKEVIHWADQAAQKIISEKGDKAEYTLAAGITPSGTVHIGNFREVITVELIKRALISLGKKVRFIYSWDDYDVFRKVPKNMPQPDKLNECLGLPLADVPDTFDCKHSSYAEHNEKEMESSIPRVGVEAEFIRQVEMNRKCSYAEEIKKALEKKDEIKSVVEKYRKEPLEDSWMPVMIYCEKCGKETKAVVYNGGYDVSYTCECGNNDSFDIRKKGIIKLLWRIDWPARWHYEKVDFESGGKDHFAAGGSFCTGAEIIKSVYGGLRPTSIRYEWIGIKGGKQFSSSSGNATTVNNALEVYPSEIVRWLFASTRPDAEFAISFDLDVLNIYEEFDKCERIYFKAEEADEKAYSKQKRIYELSCVDQPPKELPFQPSLRHLTSILQVYGKDLEKTSEYFKDEIKTEEDKARFDVRLNCALNWLENHAPEDFKFSVQDSISADLELTDLQKEALHKAADLLKTNIKNEVELHDGFYKITQDLELNVGDFFKAAYNVLINKEKGPRLASFVLIIGKEKVAALFANA